MILKLFKTDITKTANFVLVSSTVHNSAPVTNSGLLESELSPAITSKGRKYHINNEVSL